MPFASDPSTSSHHFTTTPLHMTAINPRFNNANRPPVSPTQSHTARKICIHARLALFVHAIKRANFFSASSHAGCRPRCLAIYPRPLFQHTLLAWSTKISAALFHSSPYHYDSSLAFRNIRYTKRDRTRAMTSMSRPSPRHYSFLFFPVGSIATNHWSFATSACRHVPRLSKHFATEQVKKHLFIPINAFTPCFFPSRLP